MELNPYLIQSKNTQFYIVSTQEDRVDQEVDTKPGKDSVPPNAVLRVTPLAGPVIPSVLIRGASGLYVSLKGTNENTKLTWSDQPYQWIVRETGAEARSYVVNPQNSVDLYWFDEFNVGVGDHVEVRAGRNIRPPQNEWFFSPLLR